MEDIIASKGVFSETAHNTRYPVIRQVRRDYPGGYVVEEIDTSTRTVRVSAGRTYQLCFDTLEAAQAVYDRERFFAAPEEEAAWWNAHHWEGRGRLYPNEEERPV